MRIDPLHPDRDDPILWRLAAALERRGADVVIDVHGDNLVELDVEGRPVVRAQGLPNLVHEFVHVVHAQRLDNDHGIDYARIPFPLITPSDRRVLWDELACCVLSCAYLRDSAAAHAWFAEQLDIQPVFYGFEHEPARFWRAVDALIAAHADEWKRVFEVSWSGLREALGTSTLAAPRCRLGLPALWSNFARARGVARSAAEERTKAKENGGFATDQPFSDA